MEITTAKALRTAKAGTKLHVAGLVLVRQRPGTAKGTIFMTLEDETGTVNLIVWPRVWERYRKVAGQAVALIAHGHVERSGDVIHVCVRRLEDLSKCLRGLASQSRDFR
jgi:error-prone DNA polymerase